MKLKLIAFAAISLAVLGCKKQDAPIGSDNPSQFADELRKFTASFSGVRAPSTAVSLEWDFQQGKNLDYDYVHSLRGTADGEDIHLDGSGTISLEPKADGTADASANAIREVQITAVLSLESNLDGQPLSMKQDHYIRVKRR